ncbi:FAD-dependent oxidoreductase [Tessaracoccus coleopterorum]|uniref:FAD-dependent oxidoreductase n=1 Tax=Tessaracoccus coleopterorum TaxID=2714950 RepID=UPI002F909A1F
MPRRPRPRRAHRRRTRAPRPRPRTGAGDRGGRAHRRRAGGRADGEGAVARLVAPLATGVYRTPPDALQLAVFAPRLKQAMAEHGSLLAAVAALRAPGSSAVEQPVGGMFRLVEALSDGVQVRTATPAVGLRRDGDGFVVETPTGEVRADRVAVCAPAAVAARLLAGLGCSFPRRPAAPHMWRY